MAALHAAVACALADRASAPSGSDGLSIVAAVLALLAGGLVISSAPLRLLFLPLFFELSIDHHAALYL